jgi:predicted transcriptional regulator
MPFGDTFGDDTYQSLYIDGEEVQDISGLSVSIIIPTLPVEKNVTFKENELVLDHEVELNHSLIAFMKDLGYEETGLAEVTDTYGNTSIVSLIFNKDNIEIWINSGQGGMTWSKEPTTDDQTIIQTYSSEEGMNSTLDQDIKAMLEFLNQDPTLWNSARASTKVHTYYVWEPIFNITPDEFNWVGAIKRELKWLSDNKVILNLPVDKIDSIVGPVAPGIEIFVDNNTPGDMIPTDSNPEVDGFFNLYSFHGQIYKYMPSGGSPFGEPVVNGTDEDPFSMMTLVIAGAIILILVVGPFAYTRLKRRSILDNLNRKNIFEYIKTNQGVHFKKLLRELNFQPGAMSYHLNVLEKGEYIKSIQDGNYRRFYLFGTKSDLKIALTTIQLRILSVVNERPGISQSKISDLIGKNRMVVNYHVRILTDAGIIAMEHSGRESQCFTTEITENYLSD